MSRRRISDLKPFAFSADFVSGPQASGRDDDRVAVKPAELAALGARLQADAMTAAQTRVDAGAIARIEQACARFDRATAQLSALASQLDALGEQGALPHEIGDTVRRAAQAVCDGQGDLFAACQSLSGSETV